MVFLLNQIFLSSFHWHNPVYLAGEACAESKDSAMYTGESLLCTSFSLHGDSQGGFLANPIHSPQVAFR